MHSSLINKKYYETVMLNEVVGIPLQNFVQDLEPTVSLDVHS